MTDEIIYDVDWRRFLAAHDLGWDGLPGGWDDCPFIGNGLLGATIRGGADARDGGLRWEIGRTDVVDHRPTGILHGKARLPIGGLELKPAGKVAGGETRLTISTGVAAGTIATDVGEIVWRSYVPRQVDAIVIDIETRGGESVTWRFDPALSASTRTQDPPPGYMPNPSPTIGSSGGVEFCDQPMLAGGGYATAWSLAPTGRRTRLCVCTSYATSGTAYRQEAIDAVVQALAVKSPLNASVTAWNSYYAQSFLSIPDKELEQFYWIQMYKLASAARPDALMIDLMGPWFDATPWPAIWWNLNVQLTYAPVYVANRIEMGEPLIRTIDANKANLYRNAPADAKDSVFIGRVSSYDLDSPKGNEFGNLTWALHCYYLHYRHTMDEPMLRERLFPLLRSSANYYLHLLKEGADGTLHVPAGHSPEYATAEDCNYDLALLRWLLKTLICENERLGLGDALAATWTRTLEKLTPYPVNETGLMIGAGKGLDNSHRHWSHLLAVYPLKLMDPENPAERALIETSLAHWEKDTSAWRGYSWLGAASMHALLGDGEKAYHYMRRFLDEGGCGYNTLYREAGPVIETPLQAAASLQDMLLHTDARGVIRVFPAIPAAWADAAFDHLLTEGAFRISAVREGGKTRWVRVEAVVEGLARVHTGIELVEISRKGAKAGANGIVELQLAAGEAVIVAERGWEEFVIAPVGDGEEEEESDEEGDENDEVE